MLSLLEFGFFFAVQLLLLEIRFRYQAYVVPTTLIYRIFCLVIDKLVLNGPCFGRKLLV